MMGDNPYHNQHIMEFAQCMEDAINELQGYCDSRFKTLIDVLKDLEKRIAHIEEELSCPGRKRSDLEAEVMVTKSSLKKMRDAIMNMLRM